MYLCDLTGLSVDDHAFEQLQTWFDENDPFLSASKTMRESGGSFASAIGDAYQCADRKNSLILEQAFADLFRRFMTSITDEVWLTETRTARVLCNYKGKHYENHNWN